MIVDAVREVRPVLAIGNIMKAAFIEQYGGPDVLKYGDLPNPAAGPGEVVIDVVAASVNATDWKVLAGQ